MKVDTKDLRKVQCNEKYAWMVQQKKEWYMKPVGNFKMASDNSDIRRIVFLNNVVIVIVHIYIECNTDTYIKTTLKLLITISSDIQDLWHSFYKFLILWYLTSQIE
jgi:hypothetical protein